MGAGVRQTKSLLLRAACHSSVIRNITAQQKNSITARTPQFTKEVS
jgi:hypothetical protein